MRSSRIGLLLSGALLLQGAPPARSGTPAAAVAVHRHLDGEHTVFVRPSAPYYRPQEIRLRVGESVRWVNALLAETHSVREVGAGLFAIDIPPGASASYRFQRPGQYEYRCRFHAWMRGRIVVEPRSLVAEVRPLDAAYLGARLVSSPAGPLLVARGERPVVSRVEAGEVRPAGMLAVAVRPEATPSPDGGGVWFVGRRAGELVRFDVASGRTAAWIVPAAGELSAVGGAGDGSVWLHDRASGRLGAWRPDGEVAWVPDVALDGPVRTLAVGRDGTVWLTDGAGAVAAWEPASGRWFRQSLPAGAEVSTVTAIEGGAWVVDAGRGKLLRLALDSHAVELSMPTSGSRPVTVAAAAAAGLWVVEGGDRLGRVASGGVDEYRMAPSLAGVRAAAFDDEEALWLLDPAAPRLARVGAAELREIGAESP